MNVNKFQFFILPDRMSSDRPFKETVPTLYRSGANKHYIDFEHVEDKDYVTAFKIARHSTEYKFISDNYEYLVVGPMGCAIVKSRSITKTITDHEIIQVA